MGRFKEIKGKGASHRDGARTGGPRQPDVRPVGKVVPGETPAETRAAALEPVAVAIDITTTVLEFATAALETIPAVLVPPTRAVKAREMNMGNLTRDMTRLHDEIVSAKRQRLDLMARTKQSSDARKEAVDRMTTGFRTARMEMKEQMAASHASFLGNLRKHVGALCNGVASDLEGARRAFHGGRS